MNEIIEHVNGGRVGDDNWHTCDEDLGFDLK